eukprot:CAMPEP_0174365476 /NCGR_PEP_ID=MMETSP0811_2-20130205/77325_1 /TAXON_ID=73025 ORGANISM="Eutreptiella gymnastica-like, Strain CCMP1594" /NCGR_SAMPLE_ID=MMETSP0811_2 /ASSEMBLY_ACC=CAM_ASM_000667 /LENGTH=123 /DNA_ID=CAMNT_0015506137 /DNA_START=196 /DNA_END=568 /DNA_ORIENTATION=-
MQYTVAAAHEHHSCFVPLLHFGDERASSHVANPAAMSAQSQAAKGPQKCIVYVENPPTKGPDGKLVESIAVGTKISLAEVHGNSNASSSSSSSSSSSATASVSGSGSGAAGNNGQSASGSSSS